MDTEKNKLVKYSRKQIIVMSGNATGEKRESLDKSIQSVLAILFVHKTVFSRERKRRESSTYLYPLNASRTLDGLIHGSWALHPLRSRVLMPH